MIIFCDLKKIVFLFIGLTGLPATSTSQVFSKNTVEANYVPELIARGISWGSIADSIRVNYPQKEVEYKEVISTIEYLKTEIRDSVSALLNGFFEPGMSKEKISSEIVRLGKRALPVLIHYLEKEYATRWVIPGNEWTETSSYLNIADISIRLIEEISGVYFFRNYAAQSLKFSEGSAEERKQVTEGVQSWYHKASHLNKTEGIIYFLNNFRDYRYGSKVSTAKNLSASGDTINAIMHLEQLYHSDKGPCRADMGIVQIVYDLGKDIGTEDCINSILNYRCLSQYGKSCIDHFLKNATDELPFYVMAEVVSTERYSLLKRKNSDFIWHHIFNRLADHHTPFARHVLLELLKIEDIVKGSGIASSNWKKQYPGPYDSNFRVCDFALLKLSEIFPEMDIHPDWENRESRDNEIRRYIEK